MRKPTVYSLLSAIVISTASLASWHLFRRPNVSVETVLAGYTPTATCAEIAIRYPLDGSVFPPEIPPPTFRWKDACADTNRWAIAIQFQSDKDVLGFWSESSQWMPSTEIWKTIKYRSQNGRARVTILGVNGRRPKEILSAAVVTIGTSQDVVGAPLLYREVHLPFIEAVTDPARHIRWRFGTVDSSQPPVILEGLPNCANCHSFSADGSTMAMDVDYASDKGSYVIAPVAEEMIFDRPKIITWSSYRPEDKQPTFGLLPQISPDGKYCICSVKDRSVFVDRPDLAYSQLFFPIQGILVYYDIKERKFHALPGADDPEYVQANPAWSPDGKYIVFARQKAYHLRSLRRPDATLIDADEAKEFLEEGKVFKYDLFRIPFNGGRGGQAEPLAGASHNGLSNYFPKYSPDGKWIVFCQARSFMLLQPDSQLHIIPAEGGEARRLECNTGKMNSWHSWSPNSRWLVFSSKALSAYTQLWLTHIDNQGRSTPPVLLEHFTASDKAANIPEFCNNRAGAIRRIRQEFVDDYNFYRAGHHAFKENDFESAARNFRKAVELNPENIDARLSLGVAWMSQNKLVEAEAEFRKVIELSPDSGAAYSNLGNALARQGKLQEAIEPLRKALSINMKDAASHVILGRALSGLGRVKEGWSHLNEAARLHPSNAAAVACLERGDAALDAGRIDEAIDHYKQAVKASPGYPAALLSLAVLMAVAKDDGLRDGMQAVKLAEQACEASRFQEPYSLSVLAAAFAEAGRYGDAVYMAEQALRWAKIEADPHLTGRISDELALYRAQKPCRLPSVLLPSMRRPRIAAME